jgi:hypothetical protein
MQDRDERREGFGRRDRATAPRRLEPGRTYIDLDNPENGPFVATGDEIVEPGAHIIAEEDVDPGTWRDLVSEGWGSGPGGHGHFSPDQGAFGTRNDPRSDVINAGPPGVGENLTPKEGEDEDRRG